MRMMERAKHAWNVFKNKDPTKTYMKIGPSYGYRPDRMRYSRGNERSIVTAVYNRIAMDVAAVDIKHVRLDESGRFKEIVDSGLNRCLTLEANIDQCGRSFIQDLVASMLDEGCVAAVATDFDSNPTDFDNRTIYSLRTGRIKDWYPKHVKVEVYNEETGKQEEVVLPKTDVVIVENPMYAVMNEPNSTLQRLIRKLNLLDAVDEQASSGKLDLIIQLPYVVKTRMAEERAEARRQSIETQLSEGKYGIAYTDASEKITQLNRPVENNLMRQIEYLTGMLYGQLGITQSILDGSADEKMMLNYQNRTVEPILAAITGEMRRKFLTKTAREKRQTISFFRDPFRLVPMNSLAELADKLTRNEIVTSNEVRQFMGMMPSNDPSADELRNKNLSRANADIPPEPRREQETKNQKEDSQNGE